MQKRAPEKTSRSINTVKMQEIALRVFLDRLKINKQNIQKMERFSKNPKNGTSPLQKRAKFREFHQNLKKKNLRKPHNPLNSRRNTLCFRYFQNKKSKNLEKNGQNIQN